ERLRHDRCSWALKRETAERASITPGVNNVQPTFVMKLARRFRAAPLRADRLGNYTQVRCSGGDIRKVATMTTGARSHRYVLAGCLGFLAAMAWPGLAQEPRLPTADEI